jgi:large subunit ribosomal protein L13
LCPFLTGDIDYRLKFSLKVDHNSYKTANLNSATIQQDWYVVDASSQVLGRFASQIALVIRGKRKTGYTPHVPCGDNVIVINADKIRLTGKKWSDKEYYSHSGYPGGFKAQTPKELKAKSASLIIENAVRGMLPKNRLGSELFRQLYVYNGAEHPHEAQQPKELKF